MGQADIYQADIYHTDASTSGWLRLELHNTLVKTLVNAKQCQYQFAYSHRWFSLSDVFFGHMPHVWKENSFSFYDSHARKFS